MRKFGATLIGLLALIPLYFWCLVPWQCNGMTQRMESALGAAIGGSPDARAFLRQSIRPAEACRRWVPCDVNLSIALASAYSMNGQPEAALGLYDDAFRYDKRPEMYFNRAGIRLRTGDPEGAFGDYLHAVRFNPRLANRIRNEAIRLRVEAELRSLHGHSLIE